MLLAAMKIAKERKSAVLASNAVHHRIDSLTSFVALLTIGCAHLIENASWLDPVGGLIISGMVIRAGWGNTLTSLLELGDITIDNEVKNSVRRAATKSIKGDESSVPGILGSDMIEIKEIQGIKSGQNYLVDIELAVPGDWTVHRLQRIEEAVRETAGAKVRGVRRVKVRFTSLENTTGDFHDEFIGADISPRSSPEPEDEHDHSHDHGSTHVHGNGQQANGIKKTK